VLICVPLSQGCPSRGRTHKAGHETVLYKSIETMENQDQEEVYIQRYDMESMLQRAVERFVARADISDVNKQLLERFLRDAALGKTVVGSALAEADVARMLDFCRTVEERAIIQVLFDGGFRVGELVNVRLRHVWRRTVTPGDPSTNCFFVRVPFSKTLRRTVVLPMPASTRLLNLWLEQHPGRPRVGLDGTLEARDPQLQLFPKTAAGIGQIVRRIGRRGHGA